MDDGADIPREMLAGIYERIQQRELRSNEDHVTYVTRVEQSILGMKTVSPFSTNYTQRSRKREKCITFRFSLRLLQIWKGD